MTAHNAVKFVTFHVNVKSLLGIIVIHYKISLQHNACRLAFTDRGRALDGIRRPSCNNLRCEALELLQHLWQCPNRGASIMYDYSFAGVSV